MKKVFAFLVAASYAAFAQQTMGPMKTPQLNTDYYVGTVPGTYTTIQSAVTKACSTSGGRVIIPAAATPPDTISSIVGCAAVFIEDQRVATPVRYIWTGTGPYFTGSVTNATQQNRYSVSTQPTTTLDGTYTPNYSSCITQLDLPGVGAGQNYFGSCEGGLWVNAIPGYDIGGNGFGVPAFTSISYLSHTLLDHGAGLAGGTSTVVGKTGTGDVRGSDHSVTSYGGDTGGGDEGTEGNRRSVQEVNNTFRANITGVTSNTQFTTAGSCLADCNNQGVGRYLRNKSLPNIATGVYLASFATSGTTNVPRVVTLGGGSIDPTYVSTFWGTLDAQVNTPQNVTEPLYTSMTFDVTKVGGASAPAVNDVVTTSGSFHDQSRITAVTDNGGGHYTVTVPLRKPHVAGSWIISGKGTMAFDLVANRINPGAANELDYPLECLGASDTTHLFCGDFVHGSLDFGDLGNADQTSIPAVDVSLATNTAGTVAIPNAKFSDWIHFVNVPVIYFSGAVPSAFNGPCTNTVYLNNVLSCTQAASTGLTMTTAPTVTVGDSIYGSTKGDIYPVTQVLDVRNLTATGKPVDGSLYVEDGPMTFTVGDEVQVQHGWNGGFVIDHSDFAPLNPRGKDYRAIGFDVTLNGAIYAGSSFPGLGFAFMSPRNTTLRTAYIGMGGSQEAPGGYRLLGTAWKYGLYMEHLPLNGYFMTAGCPPTVLACEDQTYSVDLMNFSLGSGRHVGTQAVGQLTLNPYAGTLGVHGWEWWFDGGLLKVAGRNVSPIPDTDGLKKFFHVGTDTGTWDDTSYSDYVAKWASGSCSGYLKSDGTCAPGWSYGGTPTATYGAGAGTGAGGTYQGTDAASNFQLTTGTTPSASSVIATITLSAARGSGGQPFCSATPADANSAALTGTAQVWTVPTSLTTFDLHVGSTALAASTSYTWNFICP